MAAKSTKSDERPKSIASNVYTLPLSCQICLGKVKQPVLCSNYHVFCRACIDTWMERSHHCPSCRVPIDDTNPVQHIRGGLNQVEDEEQEKSTPELRKLRFDLLYKDYEDTLQELEREVKRLRCENARLKFQLKSAELGRGEGSSSANSRGGKEQGGGGGSGEQLQLPLLTSKLQDAQKLYEQVKQDMNRLKKENSNLTENNAYLTSENTKLREEISKRSPHKFGRLTVATLEAQLENQRKEVQRLTRALERSDHYIESLQRQIDHSAPSSSSNPHNKGDNHLHDDDNQRPVSSDSEDYGDQPHPPFGGISQSAKNPVPDSSSSVKRQLFPKSQKESKPGSGDVGKGKLNSGSDGNDLVEHFPSSSSAKAFVSRSKDRPDSIVKKSDPAGGTDRRKEKSLGKKVHFSMKEKKSNDSSSFNLEVPSPIQPSSSIDYGQSLDNLPPESEVPTHSRPERSHPGVPDWVDEPDLWEYGAGQQKENDLSSGKGLSFPSNSKEEESTSRMRQKYSSGGSRKEASDPNSSSNLSAPDCATPQSLDSATKSYEKSSASVAETEGGRKTNGQGPNMSFNLEEPSLDDTQAIQTELKDLDISVTPELSDCLKLLNRAEKKVSHHHMAGEAIPPFCLPVSTGTMAITAHSGGSGACVSTYSSATVESTYGSSLHSRPQTQMDEKLGMGCAVILEELRNSPPSHFSKSGGYVPGLTEIVPSWEHRFFSSLRANPLKNAGPLLTHAPTAATATSSTIGPRQSSKSHVLSTQHGDLMAPPGPGIEGAHSSWTSSLPPHSKPSTLTDLRKSQLPYSSTLPPSSDIPPPSKFIMTKSLSVDHLFLPPSSTGVSTTTSYLNTRPSSSSSAYPSVQTAFSSDEFRSSKPPPSSAGVSSSVDYVDTLRSSSSAYPVSMMLSSNNLHSARPAPAGITSYPLNIASSSLVGPQNPLGGDSRVSRNALYVPTREPFGLRTAEGGGEGSYLYTEKRSTNNYSYVSNASSQVGDHTSSNHTDSLLLPEPKKRLFDFDSEEESDSGTPSKTTKML